MNAEERLVKLNNAMDQVVVKIAETESLLADLLKQELFIGGQIAEREFDTAVPDGGIQLPIFESVEELQGAMDNRGRGVDGEDEKAILEQRQAVLEREAQRKVDLINDSAD